jgi:hypothetical protein
MAPTYDDLRDAARWWPLTAFWVAGWLVSQTPLPTGARTTLAALLVAVPAVVLVVVARYTSLELTGGRCRALNKTDGDRCSLHRPPNRDFCHVHDRVHGVELVAETQRERLEDVDGLGERST